MTDFGELKRSKIFRIFVFTVLIIAHMSPVFIVPSIIFAADLHSIWFQKQIRKTRATTKEEQKVIKRQVNFSILSLICLFCWLIILMIMLIVFQNELILFRVFVVFVISAFVIIMVCTILFSKHQQYSAKNINIVVIIYTVTMILLTFFSVIFSMLIANETVKLYNAIRGKVQLNAEGEEDWFV